MKNKILCSIVVVLSVVLIVVISLKQETNHSFFAKEEPTIKMKNEKEDIEELKLEEYLEGVLAAEMPASFEMEALKAQAVASRTYALYKINKNQNQDYHILSDITNQDYISKEKMQEKWQDEYEKYLNKIREAIKETNGEVLVYQDEVIEAFYFAMSNGNTEDAQNVFQETLPYIESVPSSWDNETLNNFSVTITIPIEEFCSKLNITKCFSIFITNIKRSNSHRVNSLVINNQEYKGTEIRQKLNLRSTDFEIETLDDEIKITTKGYGHGVGMSQYGANGMAKEGYTYEQILNHYYHDVSIKKIV